MSMARLKAPFPYAGGKSTIADVVWDALGDVGVYIEPFFGSGAVLLARPHAPKVETVNDIDALLTNFWRAIQHDPDAVAQGAEYPVSELCLHARHAWLLQQHDVRERLRSDPDYYDVKVASWWVWGASIWIGHGWCSKQSQHRQIPAIAGNTPGIGVHRRRPAVQGSHVAHGICGRSDILAWFQALSERLRRVRICCGDWRRLCTPVVLKGSGYTGLFMDPPYRHHGRDPRLYAHDADIAHEVATWCREQGDNPTYRIVLAGYENDYELPGWHVIQWTTNGGYGNQGTGRGKANAQRERLWLSPYCVESQLALFAPREE